jgi:hypothetical protein
MIPQIDKPVLNGSFHTARTITDLYKTLTYSSKDASKLRLIGYVSEVLLGNSANIQAGQVALCLTSFGNGILSVNSCRYDRVTSNDVKDIIATEITETGMTDTICVQYALFTWD